jgi:hypothetical protein
MGWFNNKEKVPNLPHAAGIPNPPLEKSPLPELPSFGNHPINEQLNNEVIKSAVQDSSGENEVQVEELPQNFHFPEPQTEERKTLEVSQALQPHTSPPATKQSEPIFVRIDKFQEAKKDFEEIKRKLKEIDSVLKRVKEIKAKEDAEIGGWSDELEKVKSRISEIDESFFNRM